MEAGSVSGEHSMPDQVLSTNRSRVLAARRKNNGMHAGTRRIVIYNVRQNWNVSLFAYVIVNVE